MRGGGKEREEEWVHEGAWEGERKGGWERERG